jgi:maltose alpha-D-glucosyltransferase/alpha-amylase
MDIRRLSSEQSNTSVILGKRAMLKIYRRTRPGLHPEIEMGRFLTTIAGFRNMPALLGEATMTLEGERYAVAILQRFVENQGDAWQFTVDYLARDLEGLHAEQPAMTAASADGPEQTPAHEGYLNQIRLLGVRTGEMHRALLTTTEDPAFAAEPIGATDMEHWASQAAAMARKAPDALASTKALDAGGQALANTLLDRRDEALRLIVDLGCKTPSQGLRCRIHGDYHLGQVLLAQGDFFIVDFEGEPERPLKERRVKTSPLKDVAGMVRSFDYAAAYAMNNAADKLAGPAEQHAERLWAWRDAAIQAFLSGYHDIMDGTHALPAEAAGKDLLRLFAMEKACYELGYELANRPAWAGIPLRALLRLLDEAAGSEQTPTSHPDPEPS